MYSIISNLLAGSLLFILVVAATTISMGQNITTITAKMESKIEFQSHGKIENPIRVTQSFQAINKKDMTYKYVIILNENYEEIYKNDVHTADVPFDNFEIKNGIYYIYSTFVPDPPYNHLVIDDTTIIDVDKNQYYYSWYDPIADVTITQKGWECLVTSN